ncbi:type IV toxin-antitoxin system AbiEi family antitoxin domain-containing protein [Actinomarinicola tropica]|uniref:DUF559 domain-containing protein n=1 Tax=Actinomarinicola tropica TaxID=2789776 RepID=A0A5Q2RQS1_9ACTN|nr:type IV toxin-antitoxin system AbiEi family antitoxin domain-containing protein [Actinomarinicola tropica]QGG96776.1 hypothetical protein GH723_17670 [Actinomarinicola tropica]
MFDRVAMVVQLAAEHHGLVRADLLAPHGIDRQVLSRLTRAGVLEPIGGPGIRRLAGGVPTPHQRLLAGVWAAGPGAVASHRGAAWLWSLDGITRPVVEVSVPRSGGRRPRGVLLHHSTDLSPAMITSVDGIAVTEPTRTLIDLAGSVPASVLEEAFDSGLRQGLTTVPRSERMLDRLARPGRNGVGPFRQLLDQRDAVDGVTDSRFEVRLVRVLRRGGLPEPSRQIVLHDRWGRIGAFDLGYPEARVVVEADSVRHHMSRAQFERDRERRTRAEAIGWKVPTYTWRQVTTRPAWVVRTVEALLDASGWNWRSAA